MDLVGRWWNGAWGQHRRRDIWLLREPRWTVKARQGNAENGRELIWEFGTEHEARAMVNRLIRADARNDWKGITGLVKDRPGQPRSDASPGPPAADDRSQD